jgi:hypothetical protein
MDQCGSDTDGFDKSINSMEERNTTEELKRTAIGLLYDQCIKSFHCLEELLRSSDYMTADQLPLPTVLAKRGRLEAWIYHFDICRIAPKEGRWHLSIVIYDMVNKLLGELNATLKNGKITFTFFLICVNVPLVVVLVTSGDENLPDLVSGLKVYDDSNEEEDDSEKQSENEEGEDDPEELPMNTDLEYAVSTMTHIIKCLYELLE